MGKIMKLLCITDIHGNRQKFEAILDHEPQPDVLVIGGDFTDFGPPKEAENLLDLALLHCPNILAVAGNCDSAAIDEMLDNRDVSVHSKGKVIDEIGFFGISAMPIWRGSMYEFTEKQLDGFLSEGYQEVKESSRFIIVSHPPPHGTEVDKSGGLNIGSKSVRQWVEKIQPVLVVCGHIHQGCFILAKYCNHLWDIVSHAPDGLRH